MEKYKKTPAFVWILLFALSVLLANAIDFYAQSGELALEIMKAYQTAGINVKQTGVMVTLILLSALLYVLIFEVLARWLVGVLVRRFRLKTNQQDLVVMVRLVVIFINLLQAVISLIYFLSQDALLIVQASLTVPIISGLFMWFYASVRKRIVPADAQAKLFSYVAKIYFGIYIVLNAFNFITNMFVYDIDLSAIEIASLSVSLGVTLIMAGVAYMYAQKLKKDEEIIIIDTSDDDPFGFKVVAEEKKEEKVFKDFDL